MRSQRGCFFMFCLETSSDAFPNTHRRPRVFCQFAQRIPILCPSFRTPSIKISSFVNVISSGSPSRIRMVRRISLGITTRPRSSMRRTIPVAFTLSVSFCQFGVSVCSRVGFIRQDGIILFYNDFATVLSKNTYAPCSLTVFSSSIRSVSLYPKEAYQSNSSFSILIKIDSAPFFSASFSSC